MTFDLRYMSLFSLQIHGCAPFQFDSQLLMLNSRHFSIWGTKLVINASVEEDGTGQADLANPSMNSRMSFDLV